MTFICLVYVLFDWISEYFFQLLSALLSLLLFMTAYLSYKNRISSTLSAYFRTMVMPSEKWKIDVTGSIFPGENYLDLIITNGGPGIAKNVCWYLHQKNSKGEFAEVGSGELPYSYIGRDTNVRGYIKIYNEDRFEQKYRVTLTYNAPWPKGKARITLMFNSYGDILNSNSEC